MRVRWATTEPFHDSVVIDLMHLLREYAPSGIERVGSEHGSSVIQVFLTVDDATITASIVTAISAVEGATGEQVVGVDATGV